MTTHTATELTSPHDLLAAVPFMVGYHPKDSLVAMALVDNKVAMAMRVDFPDDLSINAISQTIALHLKREHASEAIIVGYLPKGVLQADPLASVREVIKSHDILVKECLEIRGDRFRSTFCTDLLCCPPGGSAVPLITDSRITVEQVAAGNPLPFLDLDELKQSIAAIGPDKELNKAIKSLDEIDYDADDFTPAQRIGANAINELVLQFTRNGIVQDKALVALVLVRLLDLQVRDYAMGMSTEDTSDQVWDMWRWMLRIAPQRICSPGSVDLCDHVIRTWGWRHSSARPRSGI